MEVANTLVPGSGTELSGCSGECWTNQLPNTCGSSAPRPVDSWVQEEPLFHIGRSFIVTEPNWQALNIMVSHLWTFAHAAASPPTPLGQRLTLQASAWLLLTLKSLFRFHAWSFSGSWSFLSYLPGPSWTVAALIVPWFPKVRVLSCPAPLVEPVTPEEHTYFEEIKEWMVVSTHWSHVCLPRRWGMLPLQHLFPL